MSAKLPSVTDALDGYAWHAYASCADTDDPEAFFISGNTSDRQALGRARPLQAFLMCVGCPVRRECLADALTTWIVPMGPGDGTAAQKMEVRTTGTWGGTNDRERAEVADLPLDDAIDKLEAELPDRTKLRVETFTARHPRGVGDPEGRVAQVWAKLDALGLSLNAAS